MRMARERERGERVRGGGDAVELSDGRERGNGHWRISGFGRERGAHGIFKKAYCLPIDGVLKNE
ncbi:hypothetical protein BCCH1_49710 [Burkholderia contaminans]|uniref:Uncharacterized protein n=1 Tax=Burkholderia contaminans TaxID=488447 RepID=A0A250LD73_9BURK|nr:hypothetical protein BCCH1_49710 [Burkholderia contaminans]GLZ68721.1 hypothetical protein Bcon01_17660 [Burkholderia contaminans]